MNLIENFVNETLSSMSDFLEMTFYRGSEDVVSIKSRAKYIKDLFELAFNDKTIARHDVMINESLEFHNIFNHSLYADLIKSNNIDTSKVDNILYLDIIGNFDICFIIEQILDEIDIFKRKDQLLILYVLTLKRLFSCIFVYEQTVKEYTFMLFLIIKLGKIKLKIREYREGPTIVLKLLEILSGTSAKCSCSSLNIPEIYKNGEEFLTLINSTLKNTLNHNIRLYYDCDENGECICISHLI